MFLYADIGGTKALLALSRRRGATDFLYRRRMPCADHGDFGGMLRDFLAAAGVAAGEVEGGCLALAGPIADDGRSARLTNLPWIIDAEALAAGLGLGPLQLANDFAAAALGTTALTGDGLCTIQEGEARADGVRLVVGAGTGLGMAILLRGPTGWRVLPGEGGHAAFAPAGTEQEALLRHLRRELGRVEYEHVVSGPGLVRIYRFLAGDSPEQHLLDAADPAAALAQQARELPDSIAARAMRTFLSAYGAFAGDMALATLARGGVFLAGGIAAKLLPLLRNGPFMESFRDKGGHAGLVASMPVTVVTDPELGLKGAARLHDKLMTSQA